MDLVIEADIADLVIKVRSRVLVAGKTPLKPLKSLKSLKSPFLNTSEIKGCLIRLVSKSTAQEPQRSD